MTFNAADFVSDPSEPTWGQVEDAAAAGDPEARRVISTLTLRTAKAVLAYDVRRAGEIVGNRDRQEAKLVRQLDEAGRRNAAKQKATVEREGQMLEETVAMRRLAVAGVAFGGLGIVTAVAVAILAG